MTYVLNQLPSIDRHRKKSGSVELLPVDSHCTMTLVKISVVAVTDATLMYIHNHAHKVYILDLPNLGNPRIWKNLRETNADAIPRTCAYYHDNLLATLVESTCTYL